MPARADFVRHDVAAPAPRELANWLADAVDAAKTARCAQPAATVRFVFTPSAGDEVLIGAFAPSQDQVGREFPLAIFATVPSGPSFARLPIAYDPFVESVSSLLASAPQMDLPVLTAALSHLALPGPAELQQAQDICTRTLDMVGARDFVGRLFTDGADHYAFNTFVTACRAVAGEGNQPDKGATVLDCPIAIDVDLFAWLELAQRRLGWTTRPPSYFWVEEPEPRLLLSLGPPHTQLLTLLGDPEKESQRLWPLTTTRAAAIEAASAALGATLAPFGPGSGESLGRLLDALAVA